MYTERHKNVLCVTVSKNTTEMKVALTLNRNAVNAVMDFQKGYLKRHLPPSTHT